MVRALIIKLVSFAESLIGNDPDDGLSYIAPFSVINGGKVPSSTLITNTVFPSILNLRTSKFGVGVRESSRKG